MRNRTHHLFFKKQTNQQTNLSFLLYYLFRENFNLETFAVIVKFLLWLILCIQLFINLYVIYYVMLFSVMLHYAMLWCLSYPILSCVVLSYPILSCPNLVYSISSGSLNCLFFFLASMVLFLMCLKTEPQIVIWLKTIQSSCGGSVVANLTSIHEDPGLIPGLT